MKTQYNSTLLQTRTCTVMLKLIMDLDKEIQNVKPTITKDTAIKELHERVLTIKRLHHKALNSLAAFNGKIHSEQITLMFSAERQRRYDERD
jgi:hypothetical protein